MKSYICPSTLCRQVERETSPEPCRLGNFDNPWGTVDLAEVVLAAKLLADHFHVLEALALLEVADVPDLRT